MNTLLMKWTLVVVMFECVNWACTRDFLHCGVATFVQNLSTPSTTAD